MRLINSRTFDQSLAPRGNLPSGKAEFFDVRTALSEYGSLLADGLRFLTDHDDREPPVDLVISVGFDSFSILLPLAGQKLEPCSLAIPLSRIAEAGAIAAAVAVELDLSRPRIALAIDDEAALLQTLELPHAPLRLMPHLLRNAVLTTIPFPQEQIRLAFAVKSRTRTSQVVEAAVLDGAVIDPILVSLGEAGFVPTCIFRIKSGVRDWFATPPWLVGSQSDVADLLARWKLPLRAFALAGTIVAAAVASNVGYSAVMMAQLGPDASRAISEGRRQAAIEADQQRIHVAASQAALRLAIMERLAEKLGDAIYLETLSFGREELEFSAIAPSAADVLRIVSSVPGLRDPTLKSAVSRDQNLRVERFSMTARLSLQESPGSR